MARSVYMCNERDITIPGCNDCDDLQAQIDALKEEMKTKISPEDLIAGDYITLDVDGNTVTINNSMTKEDILNVLGYQVIELSKTDDEGITVIAEVIGKIIVDSGEPPVFEGIEDATVETGTTFDPYEGVVALDSRVNEIPYEVTGIVDTETPGDYTLTYTATDEAGRTTTETRTVTVANMSIYANYVDNTLTFLKAEEGKYQDGEEVDGVIWYSDVETQAYSPQNPPKWNDVAATEQIYTVLVNEDIAPVSMYGWFWNMDIAGVDGIERIDTSNVTNMAKLFNNCHNLQEIDVSTFDTSSVTDMTDMFSACDNLTTIYASDSFVTTALSEEQQMFLGSVNLVGGAGTSYEATNVSSEYARIDTAEDSGYFTDAEEEEGE